jgi:hypothetical protein
VNTIWHVEWTSAKKILVEDIPVVNLADYNCLGIGQNLVNIRSAKEISEELLSRAHSDVDNITVIMLLP